MTWKEAILRSLEELGGLANYKEVFEHIKANNYYDFSTGKTPDSTVSAILGDLVRNGDSRVKLLKLPGQSYGYYHAKNESRISEKILTGVEEPVAAKKNSKAKTYEERDLHRLLSTYLNSTQVYSKTIYHEQSTYGKDNHQTWTHPDMVGIRILDLQSKASQKLLKAVKSVDTFKISSYELKREINNDGDLKKAFFQAVSNSSWANLGYLVALEISDNLHDEMERLNQSFGIGIIELSANPFKAKFCFRQDTESWILRRWTNFAKLTAMKSLWR